MAIRLVPFAKSLLGLAVGSIAAAATFISISTSSFDPGAFGSLLFGAGIIFMHAVPCGFLAHAILYALKWRWLPVYCLAASIEAALYGSIEGVNRSNIQMIVTAMISAAVCAAIAWFIRRPDRDS